MGLFYIIWNCIKLYMLGAVALVLQCVRKHKKYTDMKHLNCMGRVAIVTGGSRGIGLETVCRLVGTGMHVVIAGHNEVEAEASINKIKQEHPRARAGVMLPPFHLTQDGFEEQFSVNYLGHFLLTQLLFPVLKHSGNKKLHSRIINVSSVAHMLGDINWEDLAGIQCYSAHASYCQSKLAIVLATYTLDRIIQEEKCPVTANCLNPGVVNTDLYQHVNWLAKIILGLCVTFHLFLTPSEGADTTMYAALSPELEGVGGNYYDNSKTTKSSKLSYNVELQNKLQHISCEFIGINDRSAHCEPGLIKKLYKNY